jgi:hypothetical protein
MKSIPARDIPEADASFRAPEQFALAMPLIAVLGLVVVVSAVALGASGPIIALVAVGGFGLCAVAPMALIEAFVTRPLRGALAQLRAARDGRHERGPAFASGVLADLVHIARDIQAAQANIGPASLSPFQAMADANEEAARALRHQAESVAEAAADGESQIARAAQTCFADIAEAIKSMSDAPDAAGFEAAFERLESMLVYIAETQERAEAKDRHFEGAFGRVEVGMADLARLVARETETVQGTLSSSGLLVRNDIADALAQEKGGRARVLERLNTLENRLAKGADGVAAEVARLAEARRSSTGAPAGDGRLDDIAAALSRLEAEIAQALARPAPAEGIGEDLRGLAVVVARLAKDFAAREPFDAALRGLSETLAACFQEADFAGLRADVRETAAAVAGQVETLRVPAGLDRNDLNAELAGIVATGVEAISARLGARDETDAQRLEALGARVEDRLLALGREHAQTTQDAVREIGEASWERLGAEMQAVARAVEALDGRFKSKAPDAFALATDNLGAVARRLEVAQARLAAQGEDARRLAETVQSALAEVAARTESAAQRQGERLDDFAEETIDPARDALAAAARDFAAAAADFAAVRAQFEAGEPALARIVEATQGARAQLDALAESLPRSFAQTAEAQVERLAARLDAATMAPAHDALVQSQEAFTQSQEAFTQFQGAFTQSQGAFTQSQGAFTQSQEAFTQAQEAFTQSQEAFTQATEGFGAAQGRLADAVVRIEAGDPRLASVAGKTEAIRSQIDGLAQKMRAQADELAARFDVVALTPVRAALEKATESFDAAQARLAVAVEKIEAGDPRLAAVASATGELRNQIGGLAETTRAHAEELSARVDAAALTPARDALAQATESLDAAQARLAVAVEKIEAGDPRLALVAEAAKGLRVEFAALAQNLPDALSARIEAGGLVPARDALTKAARAFDSARSRLDDGAESLARLRGDLVASEARFALMLE